jgi:phosphopantetheinyl transferase (holo-ACP synthase)
MYRVGWKELQLIKEGPKPRLVFHPSKERFNLDEEESPVAGLTPTSPLLHLSLSHDADLVIAYVVAQQR